jgi:23S rRNA (adenine2503-C2)-methyltransferase
MDPYALGLTGLADLLADQPDYRARQVHAWLARGVDDPSAMTDLPLPLRERLAATFDPPPEILRHRTADHGLTHKVLLRTAGGQEIESVLMLYPRSRRATVCISTQAGCAMGCPFCATGQAGFRGQLGVGEIVRQVTVMQRLLVDGEIPSPVEHVTNVVFMGMGEPLANYKRVVAAVRRITAPSPDGLGISARGVTVSTVGLVPAIDKLTAEGLPVTLAVSLHAPDDELRDTLVPVNNRWKVAEVLDAARRYAQTTGRRVSIEYALIRDVNDHAWRADLLGKLLRQHVGHSRVHVNLIPLNPTPGSKWDASPRRVQDEFVARVQAAGIACTVRDTRGREIAAACGQLAASEA